MMALAGVLRCCPQRVMSLPAMFSKQRARESAKSVHSPLLAYSCQSDGIVETRMASHAATVSAQMTDGMLVVWRKTSNPFHPVSFDHFCSQARTNCLSHRHAIRARTPTAVGTTTSRQLSLIQSIMYLLV